MSIQKFMDISTANMKKTDEAILRLEERCAVRVIKHTYGYWVHVPFELEEQERIYPELRLQGFSDEFVGCLIKAYANNCWWINFDQDADLDEDLPSFEW